MKRPRHRTVFEETDARAIGVVADRDDAASSNSTRINQFFFAAPPGSRLVLPRGTIYVEDTLELVARLNVNNTLGLRGWGPGATTVTKVTYGPIVRVVGFYNYVADMTLDGADETALSGIYLQGLPQPGVDLPSKLNTFRNLRIVGCRIAIRVGHHSDLDGEPGDGVNPDIAGNLWQNLWLENNRYGIVRDGQNILNDHFENLFSVECKRNHVLIPFGGDFRCFTAQFGRTLEPGYPKIHSNAGSPILLVNARSENGNPPDPQPIFLKRVNSPAVVELNQVVVTNQISDPDPKRNNLECEIFGGAATVMSSSIAGKVSLIQANWVQINTEVGLLQESGGVNRIVVLP